MVATAAFVLVACSSTPPADTADTTPVAPTRPATSATRPSGTNGAPGTTGAPGAPVALSTRWKAVPLDGAIYARPVVAGNIVVAATENDSLYGLDAGDGHIVWGPTHVGDAVALADLESQGKPRGCGNINPLGITGTPVLDPATNLVYAVAETSNGKSAPPSHELVTIDAGTGAPRGSGVPIDPAGANTALLQQRPTLLLANGNVYIGLGGLYGDCGDYHGWLVSVPLAGSAAPRFYEVAADPGNPDNHAGAIWAPTGPVVDDQGRVFVSTGNSFDPPDNSYDRSDGVIALSPTLDEVGYFAPSTWREDNDRDADLGSTSPVLLPGHRLFEIGKGGTGYLVATDRPGPNPLGGVGGQLASVQVCPSYGGNTFRDPYIYVACDNGMHAVRLDATRDPPTLQAEWRTAVAASGPPVFAANTMWATDPADQAIIGVDPATGAEVARQDHLGQLTRFSAPTIAGDAMYLATANTVTSFAINAASKQTRGDGESEGAFVFRTQCAGCHGAQGEGTSARPWSASPTA